MGSCPRLGSSASPPVLMTSFTRRVSSLGDFSRWFPPSTSPDYHTPLISVSDKCSLLLALPRHGHWLKWLPAVSLKSPSRVVNSQPRPPSVSGRSLSLSFANIGLASQGSTAGAAPHSSHLAAGVAGGAVTLGAL